MQSGIVSIIGRPNVGKSSLVNALIGRKVSIVSHKPQTTRHRIQGVLHDERGQIVFVDTPGLHRGEKKALNRMMNQAAAGAIHDVDLVLFVVEAHGFRDEDQQVLDRLKDVEAPVALVLNKVDQVSDRSKLLPLLGELGAKREFAFVIPLSAEKGQNLDALVSEIFDRLPEGPALYPEDMVTGYDDSFEISELIREKLIRALHQELPYSMSVSVDGYEHEGRLRKIAATIWVEREGQKQIVIGEGGANLKRVGTSARRELEQSTGDKVFLTLWCKVKDNWSDDPHALKLFGYDPE